MRKLIVKYFALNYISKVFGKEYSVSRAACVTNFLMFCTIIYCMVKDIYPIEDPIGIVLTSFVLISMAITFLYLRFFPIKWDELTDSQKLQMSLNIQYEPTTEEWDEAVTIQIELDKKFDKSNNYNTLPIVFSVGTFLITIFMMIVL